MTAQVNLTTYFAKQVIAAALAGCNNIVPGTTWEARQLSGPTFWNSLAKPEKLHAGKIIAAAIDRSLLPLIELPKSGSNHQRYERR